MRNCYNNRIRTLQTELKTAKNSAKFKIRAEIKEIKKLMLLHC